jgi:hypothetical protein
MYIVLINTIRIRQIDAIIATGTCKNMDPGSFHETIIIWK